MKKTIKIAELECANCAAKMQEAIKKLDGVNDVNISFLTEKMKLDAREENFEELLDEIEKVMKKYEKDVYLIRK